jgi:starch phosphorylase
MNIARYLVQGVDVWLNTPIRPREASGTSGIKAAANGVLNLSILDGWWAEAYTPEIGWAIGRGEEYEDRNYQDRVESNALYDLLEKEIVPLFYDRGSDGLPRGWIQKMKASMKAVCPPFNTHRMLQEYTEEYYMPACDRHERLSLDGMALAKAYAEWKAHIRQHWPRIRVEHIESNIPSETRVGAANAVSATIYLGELTPDDVTVELYYGPVDASGEIVEPHITEMNSARPEGNPSPSPEQGRYAFSKRVIFQSSGRHGFTVRVVPRHPEQVNPFETGLILWG